MCECRTTVPRISLMAAAELRDVLSALERGKGPVAIAALMAIDPESWQAIEHRLAAVGGDLRALLDAAGEGDTRRYALR
ncbi:MULTISPECIES: hypothetical protein [Streptomyces]|uniref:hypothetical protein n=1 Tax=Streptomyces TaxID=1883 RepID=UPI00163CC949|nr:MULTISPECIES: hypothetical protein [Streptomyces]MBC2877856.1 hypothetical protein [Streptomyces sp. TYQ1024]UBI37993.1 hypothetical protein K7I03_16960 [Streptomyces mobaraensis]UKW30580.1 hypothetical protein MCU78_16915 [Streptomyces sp. TYQ1024]